MLNKYPPWHAWVENLIDQRTIIYTKRIKLTLWVMHTNACGFLHCIHIAAYISVWCMHNDLLTFSWWSAFDLCLLPGVTPPTGRRCLCCRRYQRRPAQTAHQTQAVPHLHSSQRKLIHTRVVVAVPVIVSVCVSERERERERVSECVCMCVCVCVGV